MIDLARHKRSLKSQRVAPRLQTVRDEHLPLEPQGPGWLWRAFAVLVGVAVVGGTLLVAALTVHVLKLWR